MGSFLLGSWFLQIFGLVGLESLETAFLMKIFLPGGWEGFLYFVQHNFLADYSTVLCCL